MTEKEVNSLPTVPEQTASFPQRPMTISQEKFKKRTFLLVGVLLVILILASMGLVYYQNQRSISQDSPSVPLTSQSTPQIAKEEANVEYLKREKILGTVKYQSNTDLEATSGEDWELDVYDFYKVGTVTSGKYKDGELLLVLFKAGGPCKSAACGKPIRLRYIKKGNAVTFLPKISTPISFVAADDSLLKANPFKKFGFSLTVDSNLTIPILEYPKEITGNNPRQLLKDPVEEDGEGDSSKLYKVFTHPVFGDIYTTKPEFSPSKSFEPEGGGFGAKDTLEGCRGAFCFTTNAFFAFRPDGTFLKFAYYPDFSTNDITWDDNKLRDSEYIFNTVAGCSRDELDHNSVVFPLLVSETDLVTIGKTKNIGDTIYGLKDQNHNLYTEFYNTYKEYYAGQYIYPEEKRQTKSFSEFINALPIFLWRDPFGRLIRFNNEEFLPPFACEPIIYLYPQTTQRVSIAFDEKVHLSDSTPDYGNGWHVIAYPSGKLQNLSDNRTYPYLFWEGWSLIFPIQSEGFVVKQNEVASFLEKTLPKLGLNEKEREDFMKAWLPYFSDSPYYFITFLNKDVIDKIAPLRISPKPDTITRVLMDFKPLEKPIITIEPEFTEPPQRIGFTVVEWGGLRRYRE